MFWNSGWRRSGVLPVPRLVPITAALLLLMLACSDLPLVAPEDSRIELTMAPSTLAANGDLGRVTALVTEKDGLLVENGTQVVFIATGGDLCEPIADGGCEWRSVVSRETTSGIATVTARSGKGASLNVVGRSGAITGTKDFPISSLVAPAGAKVVMRSDPDTIPVGGSAQVHAFLTTAEGAPVADDTRVVFHAAGGRVGRSIVLTRDGFASTPITAAADSTPSVTIVSGNATSTLTIPVRQ